MIDTAASGASVQRHTGNAEPSPVALSMLVPT